MRTRADRINSRKKKITQRSNLLGALAWWSGKDYCYSKLANNNEMNAIMSRGTSTKTNTRKGHSNYRRKGGFGSANNYAPKDARQLDDMYHQLNDM